jgi:hypothetical protein
MSPYGRHFLDARSFTRSLLIRFRVLYAYQQWQRLLLLRRRRSVASSRIMAVVGSIGRQIGADL